MNDNSLWRHAGRGRDQRRLRKGALLIGPGEINQSAIPSFIARPSLRNHARLATWVLHSLLQYLFNHKLSSIPYIYAQTLIPAKTEAFNVFAEVSIGSDESHTSDSGEHGLTDVIL